MSKAIFRSHEAEIVAKADRKSSSGPAEGTGGETTDAGDTPEDGSPTKKSEGYDAPERSGGSVDPRTGE